MHIKIRFPFMLLLVILLFHVAHAQQPSPETPRVEKTDGDVHFVHDPSIIRDGPAWYLFSTANGPERNGELPIRCSLDLHHWNQCGAVFSRIPDWIQKDSPGTKELWAPDISFFGGQYHLYYAYSLFGKNTSGIALLTNQTLDPKSPNFHWVDHGLVLRSQAADDFNAIDPNLVLDAHGGVWLAFGSFWNGIKMRRLDAATGKLSTEDTKLYSLASRKRPDNPPLHPPGLPDDWQAIEAPFIVHHDGFYYLFVSFDLCCRGTNSNYKTMVGRSREVTGPYVDKNGVPMLDGGGSAVLVGNQRWLGPGGESLLMGGGNQKEDIIVFHAYDAVDGSAWLQISTIAWKDGWPSVALEGDAASQARNASSSKVEGAR